MPESKKKRRRRRTDCAEQLRVRRAPPKRVHRRAVRPKIHHGLPGAPHVQDLDVRAVHVERERWACGRADVDGDVDDGTFFDAGGLYRIAVCSSERRSNVRGLNIRGCTAHSSAARAAIRSRQWI